METLTAFAPRLNKNEFNSVNLPNTRRVQIPSQHLEAECALLVSAWKILDSFYLPLMSCHVINNTYLSSDYIPMALEYLQRQDKTLRHYVPEEFSKCRIRPVTIKLGKFSETTYELALKGKKDIYDDCCRLEIGSKIPKELYSRILNSGYKEDEVEGHLLQYRYPLPIETYSGVKVTLEIDFIREAGVGNQCRRYSLKNFPYAVVGYEVQHGGDLSIYDRGVADLYSDRHGVEFLKGAIPITPKNGLSEVISKTTAARDGLDIWAVHNALALAAAA